MLWKRFHFWWCGETYRALLTYSKSIKKQNTTWREVPKWTYVFCNSDCRGLLLGLQWHKMQSCPRHCIWKWQIYRSRWCRWHCSTISDKASCSCKRFVKGIEGNVWTEMNIEIVLVMVRVLLRRNFFLSLPYIRTLRNPWTCQRGLHHWQQSQRCPVLNANRPTAPRGYIPCFAEAKTIAGGTVLTTSVSVKPVRTTNLETDTVREIIESIVLEIHLTCRMLSARCPAARETRGCHTICEPALWYGGRNSMERNVRTGKRLAVLSALRTIFLSGRCGTGQGV